MEKQVAAAQLISGLGNVLSQSTRLRGVAESTGLASELAQLPYLLSEGVERGKRPYMVMFDDAGGEPGGGVLFQAYEFAGISTRTFMPVDFSGVSNVIAPATERRSLAVAAARFLYRRGALLALSSVAGQAFSGIDAATGRSSLCAVQTRPVREKLLLKETLEDTLAAMGAHTRRNFRYYTRRAATSMGVRFSINEPVTTDEFYYLNRQSPFAASESLARWRFMSWRKFEGAFMAALRDRDGRCLSLLGGRIAGSLADVDWQMNLAELTADSISTVMRAHLLAYLVGRGVRVLRFEGGTPHTMNLSFQEETVGDFLITRRALGPWFFDRVIAPAFPHDNRFANVFRHGRMRWVEAGRGGRSSVFTGPCLGTSSSNDPCG